MEGNTKGEELKWPSIRAEGKSSALLCHKLLIRSYKYLFRSILTFWKTCELHVWLDYMMNSFTVGTHEREKTDLEDEKPTGHGSFAAQQ